MSRITIDFSNILKLLALLLSIWLIYTVSDVLILIFIAVILTSALNPLVDYLESRKVKRGLATFFIFGSFLIFIGLLFWFLIPPIIQQGQTFVTSLPSILSKSFDYFRVDRLVGEQNIQDATSRLSTIINDNIASASLNVLKFGLGLFDGLLSAFTVVILTFYMLAEHRSLKDFMLNFAPQNQLHKAGEIFDQVEKKLGVWLRGQLLVMLLIGVATFIGLSLLGVQFALPLAILAALFEIIPFIGPSIAAIPAILIALTQSPLMALSVVIFSFVIQQLESSLIIPKVMNQAVGLNPIVVIIAVMIGARLDGPLGTLLSIPFVAVLILLYQEWRQIYSSAKPEIQETKINNSN